MYSAPKKLKDHRNAMFLHLDQIKEIHGTGEVKEVNFDKLENKTQIILDLMRDVPEDFFVFLNHVGVIPDTVLFQTGATKVMIEAMLRNESATYHSSNGKRRKITPQALLRERFLTHMREWKFMVERLIKPGKSIKMRFNELEDKCLSMRGSIKTAITQTMDQKDSTMGPWALWARLGVHFGIYKPRELRYLVNALDEVEDLYTVVKDLSNLFGDLWTNTMAINTNLDNLIEILRKGSDSLYGDGDDGEERLISLLGKLEKSAKDVQDAHESVEGKPKSPYEEEKASSAA